LTNGAGGKCLRIAALVGSGQRVLFSELRRVRVPADLWHPALQQLRTITFHYPDNEAIVAYSKFDPATGDQVLVVVTLKRSGPRRPRCGWTWPRWGWPYDRLWVRDAITGEEYQWGQSNFVRIEPAKAVAHILNMPQIPADQRLNLLRRE
jgi:starch synthase (maltosyl-transferring)